MRKTVFLTAVLLIGGAAVPAFAATDAESKAWLLKTKVEAALLEKGGAGALPIQVAVDRKTVILTGEVESIVTQELAKEVALSVRGVGQVENRLRVAGEKPMTEMSAGTLRPASPAARIAPRAIMSDAANTAVGGSSRDRRSAMARRPLST